MSVEKRYVITKSNYTKKNSHKKVTDGSTIYERDYMTTTNMGGFDSGVFPWGEGNFKFVHNPNNNEKGRGHNGNWAKFCNNEYWSLDCINQKTSGKTSDESYIKPNIKHTSLLDFAYYGSCVKLLQSAIEHIIKTYPGSLYFTDKKFEYINSDGEKKDASIDGFGALYILENHFGNRVFDDFIDSTYLYYGYPNGNLRYDGYDKNDNKYFKYYSVQSQNINNNGIIINKGEICLKNEKTYKRITRWKNSSIGHTDTAIMKCTLNGEDIFFHNGYTDSIGDSIRPKREIMDEFYNNLTDFERFLLNPDSTPLYTIKIEHPYETENGVVSKMEKFTWPTTSYGSLDIESVEYTNYVSRLLEIAEWYDNNRCNNIWRNMVHDSLKNMDKTYTNTTVNEGYDDYVLGISRLETIVEIYGRFFDDIKLQIDTIKAVNNLGYNNKNNLPYYFLSDDLEKKGWEVYNVANGFVKTTTVSNLYSGSTKEYTVNDANITFLKNLSLNSKGILSRKGTRASIEMILSMFGLKSKEWVDHYNKTIGKTETGDEYYDYTLEEKVAVVDGETMDLYNEVKKYNAYKNNYNTEFNDGDFYGLPVAVVNIGSGNAKTNLFKKEYMTGWNKVTNASGTTTIGSDEYGKYYAINPKKLYEHVGLKTTFANVLKDVKFKQNTRYTLKVRWKINPNANPIYSGLYIGFSYEGDEVNHTWAICESGFTGEPHTTQITSTKSKNVRGICVTYGTSNTTQIYNISLTEGEENEKDGWLNDTTYLIPWFYKNVDIDGNPYFQMYGGWGKVSTKKIEKQLSSAITSTTTLTNSGNFQIYDETKKYLKIVDNVDDLKELDGKKLNNDDIYYVNEKGNDYKTNYFILKDKTKYTDINEGWENITSASTTETKYKVVYLENIIESHKGNNPHVGYGKYDNGDEYFKIYENLFKNAIDEGLMGDNAYNCGSTTEVKPEISNVGFVIKKGIKDNMKCWYFTNNNTTNNIRVMEESYGVTTNIYQLSGTTIDKDVPVGSGKTINFETNLIPYSFEGKKEKYYEEAANSIINTKGISLKFNKKYRKDGSLKNFDYTIYFENVIKPYVSQVIPSTTIFDYQVEPYYYTATFLNESGQSVSTITISEEKTFSESGYQNLPTLKQRTEGGKLYFFHAWQPAINSNTKLSKDTVYTPTWTTEQLYTFTVKDRSDSEIVKVENVRSGATFTLTIINDKTKANILGKYDNNYISNNNISLTGKYGVNYETDDKVYTFDGIQNTADNKVLQDNETFTLTKNANFKVHYSSVPMQYTVTFYNSTTKTNQDAIVSNKFDYGTTIQKVKEWYDGQYSGNDDNAKGNLQPYPSDTKYGYNYKFKDWSIKEGSTNTTVTKNLTLYGTYTETPKDYTITFYFKFGSTTLTTPNAQWLQTGDDSTIDSVKNKRYNSVRNITIGGYTYAEWKTEEGDIYVYTTRIDSNGSTDVYAFSNPSTRLTATNVRTLGGSKGTANVYSYLIGTQEFSYDRTFKNTSIDRTIKTGAENRKPPYYIFNKWVDKDDKQLTTAGFKITGDTTFYTVYTGNTYTLTYDANQGCFGKYGQTTPTAQTKTQTIQYPTKVSFLYGESNLSPAYEDVYVAHSDGKWYTSKAATTEYKDGGVLNKDTTIYARYIDYTITVCADENSNNINSPIVKIFNKEKDSTNTDIGCSYLVRNKVEVGVYNDNDGFRAVGALIPSNNNYGTFGHLNTDITDGNKFYGMTKTGYNEIKNVSYRDNIRIRISAYGDSELNTEGIKITADTDNMIHWFVPPVIYKHNIRYKTNKTNYTTEKQWQITGFYKSGNTNNTEAVIRMSCGANIGKCLSSYNSDTSIFKDNKIIISGFETNNSTQDHNGYYNNATAGNYPSPMFLVQRKQYKLTYSAEQSSTIKGHFSYTSFGSANVNIVTARTIELYYYDYEPTKQYNGVTTLTYRNLKLVPPYDDMHLSYWKKGLNISNEFVIGTKLTEDTTIYAVYYGNVTYKGGSQGGGPTFRIMTSTELDPSEFTYGIISEDYSTSTYEKINSYYDVTKTTTGYTATAFKNDKTLKEKRSNYCPCVRIKIKDYDESAIYVVSFKSRPYIYTYFNTESGTGDKFYFRQDGSTTPLYKFNNGYLYIYGDHKFGTNQSSTLTMVKIIYIENFNILINKIDSMNPIG